MARFWDTFPEKNAFMYSLDDGLLYTARFATPFVTERTPAVLLMSLDDRKLCLQHGQSEIRAHAIFVGRGVRRSLKIWDTPFAGVHIGPSHPLYRGLHRATQEQPVQAMDVEAFSGVQQGMADCFHGSAKGTSAQRTLAATAEVLAEVFRIRTERDPRIDAVIAQLRAISPLDYEFSELLDQVRLSPSRFSHLFTKEVGISLRSYQKWRKVREALKLLQNNDDLTSIAHRSGFSDSAHFSRTFSNTFGLVPTLFRPGRCVQVIGDRMH